MIDLPLPTQLGFRGPQNEPRTVERNLRVISEPKCNPQIGLFENGLEEEQKHICFQMLSKVLLLQSTSCEQEIYFFLLLRIQ